MISPCTGVCTVENGECIGCGRTLDDIAKWSMMSMAERMEIMNALAAKRPLHNCPRCSGLTTCALSAGKSISSCWCRGLEPIPSSELQAFEDKDCLCKSCLKDIADSAK